MQYRKLFMRMIYFLIIQMSETVPPDMQGDPNFSAPITNMTVPVGRDATLTCRVHDLISYKIAWLRVDTQTILTIQNHVITKNTRIGITHTENRIWQLRIRDVKESDQGWYMCQINTDPMKSQLGYLDIVVPPDIVDNETSQDSIVEEGQNLTLTCSAKGSPAPTIEWKREKGTALETRDGQEVLTLKGPKLYLRNINRQNMGAYLCIASNGVPPTVSKRISLIVNFPPIIWVRQEIIHTELGQRVSLECVIESHPASINSWIHNGQEHIKGGSYESVVVEHVNKVIMKLIVRPMHINDFGLYKCVARNLLGTAERSIFVYRKKGAMLDHYIEPNPFNLIGKMSATSNGSWKARYFSNSASMRAVSFGVFGIITALINLL